MKWIQRLAELQPDIFASAAQRAFGKPSTWTVNWVSPRSADDWAEYRDGAFLERLGLERLKGELAAFWPAGGPQWDGLATVPGGVLLVEAKAHFAELTSSCGAGELSLAIIKAACTTTKSALGASSDADWTTGFYQYANRLAHLQFLRDRGVDAYLVFLYFTGDTEMPNAPMSEHEWKHALGPVSQALGLPSEKPLSGVGSVFIDTSALASAV